MWETFNLELKEKITNSFLKTVTAFANYDGGRIIFGIDDNDNVKEIQNPIQAALDIENKINDSISPKVDYLINIDEKKKIVELVIFQDYKSHIFINQKHIRDMILQR